MGSSTKPTPENREEERRMLYVGERHAGSMTTGSRWCHQFTLSRGQRAMGSSQGISPVLTSHPGQVFGWYAHMRVLSKAGPQDESVYNYRRILYLGRSPFDPPGYSSAPTSYLIRVKSLGLLALELIFQNFSPGSSRLKLVFPCISALIYLVWLMARERKAADKRRLEIKCYPTMRTLETKWEHCNFNECVQWVQISSQDNNSYLSYKVTFYFLTSYQWVNHMAYKCGNAYKLLITEHEWNSQSNFQESMLLTCLTTQGMCLGTILPFKFKVQITYYRWKLIDPMPLIKNIRTVLQGSGGCHIGSDLEWALLYKTMPRN